MLVNRLRVVLFGVKLAAQRAAALNSWFLSSNNKLTAVYAAGFKQILRIKLNCCVCYQTSVWDSVHFVGILPSQL